MDVLAWTVSRLPLSWIKRVSSSQFRYPWAKRAYDRVAARFRNRDQTIVGGVGKGLRFNPGGTNAGYVLGTNDPEVQKALAGFLKPGAVFYDIGANVGFLTVLAARIVGPEGRVFCFEPLAENVRQLEHNVRLNGFGNVAVHPVAVGNRDGNVRFLVASASTLGKLADYEKPGDPIVGATEVPVRRLDGLRDEAKMPAPDLVKIDVEGAEADVLTGGAATINASRPLLMIELHGTNEAVAAKLEELGYRAFVLGSRDSVVEAPYWAFILAAPAERPEAVAHAERVATAAGTYR